MVPVSVVIYLAEGMTTSQEDVSKFICVEHLLRTAFGDGAILYRKAPIRLRKAGAGFEVTIPRTFHAVTQPLLGADDKQLVVEDVDFQEGSRWLLGKSTTHINQDPEERAWHWEVPIPTVHGHSSPGRR